MAGALLFRPGHDALDAFRQDVGGREGEAADASTGDEHKFHESLLSRKGDRRANPGVGPALR
jgi:hypothetical protein